MLKKQHIVGRICRSPPCHIERIQLKLQVEQMVGSPFRPVSALLCEGGLATGIPGRSTAINSGA